MDSGRELGSQGTGCPLPVCSKGGLCLDEEAPASSSVPNLPDVSCFPLEETVSASAFVSCKACPSFHSVSAPSSSSVGCGLGGAPASSSSFPQSSSGRKSFSSHLSRLKDAAPGSPLASSLPIGVVPSQKGSFSGCCADVSSHELGVQLTGSGDGGASPPSSALPSSSAQVLRTPFSPVRGALSSRTDGPCYAQSDAPQVPDSSHLLSHSNFENFSSMFPPLQSNPDSVEITPPALPMDCPGASCEQVIAKDKLPSDWASLLKATPSSMQLKFIKPEFSSIEGKISIKLPSSVALKGSSIWKNTMVGFFLDRLPFSLVQASAMKHWGKLGLLNVLSNGNGFFFFNFPDSASLNVALEGGPWYFGGRPIFLKRWSPCMNLSKEGCRKVPIWAHFYNVPLEFWNEDGLSYIASMVGKPLHADNMTSSLRRLSYARICIEIDINDSLPEAFDIELEDGSVAGIQIAYNWIPKRCSVCKVFGHLSSNCKKAGHQVWIPKSAHPTSLPPRDGEWKTVDSRRKAEPDNLSLSLKARQVSVSKSQGDPNPIALHLNGLLSSVNSFDALSSDEVLPAMGLHAESAGAAEVPIAAADVSNGPGFGVLFPVDKPSGLGGGDPIAVDDPLGDGVGVPLPVGDRSGIYCSPDDFSLNSNDQLGISSAPSSDHDRGSPISGSPSPSSSNAVPSPSSGPSNTSLLAKKLIMVDEIDKLLGRKKKDKKKKHGSPGNSRGKTSKISK